MSVKFEKLMHDLDAVRRINHIQKQKLERYASIAALNATVSETPTPSSGLRGGTGGRDSYLSDYETPGMSKKSPSNADLPEDGIRDIPGRKKI